VFAFDWPMEYSSVFVHHVRGFVFDLIGSNRYLCSLHLARGLNFLYEILDSCVEFVPIGTQKFEFFFSHLHQNSKILTELQLHSILLVKLILSIANQILLQLTMASIWSSKRLQNRAALAQDASMERMVVKL
jgi:hypothetical protein